MADENTSNTTPEAGDILSQLLGSNSDRQTKLLESIDKSMKEMLKSGRNMSSIDARNRTYGNPNSTSIGNYFSNRNSFGAGKAGSGSFMDGLEKAILDGVLGSDFKQRMNTLLGSFADQIGVSIKDLPNALGKAAGERLITSLKGSSIGKGITDRVSSSVDGFFGKFNTTGLKNSSQQSAKVHNDMPAPSSVANSIRNNTPSYASDSIIINAKSVTINDLKDNADAFGFLTDLFGTPKAEGAASAESALVEGAVTSEELASLGTATAEMSGSVVAADAALTELIAPIMAVVPEILLVVGAITIVTSLLEDALGPAIEHTKKAFETISAVANRYEKSREQVIKTSQDRLVADVNTMVETPFKILNDAAEKWYSTWDNNLRKINATQGYTKADLQDLMSVYAERLRQDNLSSVVSAADITENLARVLDSGLSGKIAEEFAYLATNLNAAVPTQDFFAYSESYASLAANQIRLGKSQEEAILYANQQIERFASNVLYAGRELAGGFSSGLKNAEAIFTQSVQIAQAAKTNNQDEISGVLTAVSAITGAIAPDLASSMTEAVFKAATGGNSSELVALRSLAGVNASNTEFLKALASNPKQIFTTLFNTLAERQNMAPDAFMEVAEGLSSVFGVSMDAFARVDFAYLADAISNMDTSNNAIASNLKLLISGNTTTNAEMMRMQDINKYMIDEGLSLVLDNEAGRAIQQHMWDEQLSREMQEATYGVELRGAALEFLEGIAETIDNILDFLNPVSFIGKIIDFGESVKESNALQYDIATLLGAGNVGQINRESFYQLNSRGVDLNLTEDLISKFGLGLNSMYSAVSANRELINRLNNPVTESYASSIFFSPMSGASQGNASASYDQKLSNIDSKYTWNTVSKSFAKAIASTDFGSLTYNNEAVQLLSNTQKAQDVANGNLVEALNSMKDFVATDTEHTMSYKDWEQSVKEQYHIADFDKAIESAGLTKSFVQAQYAKLETQAGAKEKVAREQKESTFWDDSVSIATESRDKLTSIDTNLVSQQTAMTELLEEEVQITNNMSVILNAFRYDTLEQMDKHGSLLKDISKHGENLYKKFMTFQKSWNDYFIEHKVYNSAFNSSTYDKIVRKEREGSETAIYALADALTQNDVGLLLDPSLQTNALLAQILKVVSALLAQGNTGVTQTALPSTLTSLLLNSSNI